jgi:hypothetical protein
MHENEDQADDIHRKEELSPSIQTDRHVTHSVDRDQLNASSKYERDHHNERDDGHAWKKGKPMCRAEAAILLSKG